MKRPFLTTAIIILLIALVSANVLGQGNKKTSSKINWVDIKKVCIEYEVTGMGKGMQKVYIGDWGNEHLRRVYKGQYLSIDFCFYFIYIYLSMIILFKEE